MANDTVGTRADFSHNFPMPKKNRIRCENHHITKAQFESPIRCEQCKSYNVIWEDYTPKLPIPTKGYDGEKYRSFKRLGA